jgi:glycosyltransferase involved in cell wall biosynthesis
VFLLHAEMRGRMSRHFPQVEFTVRAPAEVLSGARPVAAPLRPGAPLRVALMGRMVSHKGLPVLLACAADAADRRLPVEFRVVGPCDRAAELEAFGNVRVTGEYREEAVFDVLAEQECHCALFLSTVPETHSYTLSTALAGGLYALGLDIGAQGARVREAGWGEVIPFDASAEEINERLLAARERLAKEGPPRRRAAPVVYGSILADHYGLTPELREAPVRRLSLPLAG